ncbi:MAG: hypothetical protein CMJ49_10225 [Planctomycetaceae bacterium]|nr:hypothetical protein [Planctomycetaceae bacterium]
MNNRQRFDAAMHYQPRDRSPLQNFSFWAETLTEWRKQDLPEWVTLGNHTDFFGDDGGFEKFSIARSSSTGNAKPSDKGWVCAADLTIGWEPRFEEVVIEDRGEHELVQQADGVRVLRRKYMSSIPLHDSHLLVDRASWEKHYRPRFDPSTASRYPEDWKPYTTFWCDQGRDCPMFLPGGSLYGWIRNLMGLEAVSYVVHDDPAWFEEMVTTIADCIIGVLERVLACGARFEGCGIWEDMCFNGGPLLSPAHFKRFLVPHYERITSLLHKHGCDVIWVDCDGCIDELIPLWMDAGVNCMMPIEIGTWGADPVRYRREYGKDLLMMGGFDKHILADSTRAIEAEVDRLTPLIEEGGFIAYCDHRVPPDVSLEHYLFYTQKTRERWGGGVNLNPMADEAIALCGVHAR